MRLARTKSELRQCVAELPRPIGLVPTMGYLHAGHLELVRWSTKDCQSTIATIFVNPMQFGANEDLDNYPTSFEKDRSELASRGVDVLFAPAATEMYDGEQAQQTTVSVPGISRTLCGDSRPGHFDGVTTVVTKLFNLCQPDIAYFGEKDWQQLTILKRMVEHLDFGLKAVGVPIVRESDGLALSSRNKYLSSAEREIAPRLHQELEKLAAQVRSGGVNHRELEVNTRERLDEMGFKTDYVQIRNQDSLALSQAGESNLRIFGAAYCGKARLIDNLPV